MRHASQEGTAMPLLAAWNLPARNAIYNYETRAVLAIARLYVDREWFTLPIFLAKGKMFVQVNYPKPIPVKFKFRPSIINIYSIIFHIRNKNAQFNILYY